MIEKKADEKPVEIAVVAIVDPKSLGMESQAGEAPPKVDTKHPPNMPEDQLLPRMMSLNEPPGSNVLSKSIVEPFKGKASPPAPGTKPVPNPEHATADDPQDDIEEEFAAMQDDGDVEPAKHKKKK